MVPTMSCFPKSLVGCFYSMLAGLAVAGLTGCMSNQTPTIYKTTFADPHPYPVSVIRTTSKPEKAGEFYKFMDPNGVEMEIPAQYVARVEKVKAERDKNDPDLVERSRPKKFEPRKEYFRTPFEFR